MRRLPPGMTEQVCRCGRKFVSYTPRANSCGRCKKLACQEFVAKHQLPAQVPVQGTLF